MPVLMHFQTAIPPTVIQKFKPFKPCCGQGYYGGFLLLKKTFCLYLMRGWPAPFCLAQVLHNALISSELCNFFSLLSKSNVVHTRQHPQNCGILAKQPQKSLLVFLTSVNKPLFNHAQFVYTHTLIPSFLLSNLDYSNTSSTKPSPNHKC